MLGKKYKIEKKLTNKYVKVISGNLKKNSFSLNSAKIFRYNCEIQSIKSFRDYKKKFERSKLRREYANKTLKEVAFGCRENYSFDFFLSNFS